MSSLPEAIFDKIEILIKWLIKLKAINKGGELIMQKVQDIFALA